MGCCQSATSAYPGERRVAKPAYQPSDDEYKQVNSTTAVANAHFVTCPGGNALKLVGKPNRSDGGGAAAASGGGAGLAKYISVTLPDGVRAGDVIHVRAPDGRLNAITVPDGMGPGSTFTVEFSDDAPPPQKEEDLAPGVYVPTVTAEPEVEAGVPAPYAAEASAPAAYDPNWYGKGGDGMETAVVAQPATGPYVPAYAAK